MKSKGLFEKFPVKWYLFAVFSLTASSFFAIYNLVVGVIFGLIWNISISFYYLLLMIVKTVIVYSERKWKEYSKNELLEKRIKLFQIENVFLLLIDLALLAPVLLLIFQQKQNVDVGMIPTIALAAFTTYKIIIASINYTKAKKGDNLTVQGLRIISLKEAIVSIITLQNTMIYVFGEGGEMQTLAAWTSMGMLASLLAISICQFIKINKLKK